MCVYALVFRKRPGRALIGACALIRTNTVIRTQGTIQSFWPKYSIFRCYVISQSSIIFPESMRSLTQLYTIRKTCPRHVYPLEHLFYIVKVGFTGVYLFFLFLLQNIDCGYSLEPPRRGGSNVYPQSMFRAKIRKISKKISTENFQFLQLKNLCILHGRVFIMKHNIRLRFEVTILLLSSTSYCQLCTIYRILIFGWQPKNPANTLYGPLLHLRGSEIGLRLSS